jgi:NADH dehydrogenase FAD-containing subunit
MLGSAERDPSVVAKGALNFVIVGAGPTGTEMAVAFGDMLRSSLKKKAHDRAYKDLAAEQAQIFLMDGGHALLTKRLLPSVSDLRRQNASVASIRFGRAYAIQEFSSLRELNTHCQPPPSAL